MRRFYGFLVLITSLLLIVFANVQNQVRDLTTGLEYNGGYETLYEVDLGDSGKTMKDIADIVNKRLEDADVENASVEYEEGQDETDERNFIRIGMNAETEDDLDYVLRSVEATGKITVSTLMDSGDYVYEISNPFEIGSAEVEWNGSTPYVTVDIKDAKDFRTFTETCNSAYEDFQNKYNSSDDDDEESNITGVMVIWLDKTDSDSYYNIYAEDDEAVSEQMKSKILAIVPTDNYHYTEDANGDLDDAELYISYYDYEQTTMVAGSAHTIERILNYQESSYTMNRVYTHAIDATAGSNYTKYVFYGICAASLLLLVYLVLRFRLAGLAGWTAVATSLFVQLLLLNFFGYTFTTMVAIGFVVSLVANAAYVITYLFKFRDEMLKGKTPVKARQEAHRVTLSNYLDISILVLFVAVISVFVVSSQVKLFPTTLILGLLCSVIINRLLTLFGMYWLTNNKLAGEKKSIFGLKNEDVPDVLKQESQKKFNPLHEVDPLKHGKKAFTAFAAISAVCAVLIGVFGVVSAVSKGGVSVFNESDEAKDYTRIEISSELDSTKYLFKTKKQVQDYFAEKYPDWKISNIDIIIEDDVAIYKNETREDLPDIAYVSVALEDTLKEADYETYAIAITKDLKEMDYGDTAVVAVTTVKSGSVRHLLNASIILISLVAGLALAFILIRFGYTYAIATFASVVPSALVTFGFYAATRLEISSLSLTGIAAGLLLVILAQLPLFENMKKLKHDAKHKVTTYEERESIAVSAFRNTMVICLVTLASALAAILVTAIASPYTYSILSTYGSFAVSVIIGGLTTYFILLPVYLFAEKHWHIKFVSHRAERNRKKMEEAKANNRNAGAEPMESIIPGIND